MRRRHVERRQAVQQANAALCGLPLTDYLALSRAQRCKRLRAARRAMRAKEPTRG